MRIPLARRPHFPSESGFLPSQSCHQGRTMFAPLNLQPWCLHLNFQWCIPPQYYRSRVPLHPLHMHQLHVDQLHVHPTLLPKVLAPTLEVMLLLSIQSYPEKKQEGWSLILWPGNHLSNALVLEGWSLCCHQTLPPKRCYCLVLSRWNHTPGLSNTIHYASIIIGGWLRKRIVLALLPGKHNLRLTVFWFAIAGKTIHQVSVAITGWLSKRIAVVLSPGKHNLWMTAFWFAIALAFGSPAFFAVYTTSFFGVL